tara:strand:+ start:2944 stop:3501 length:558 start_codon:yes stop_codon:yes gene_type:complete
MVKKIIFSESISTINLTNNIKEHIHTLLYNSINEANVLTASNRKGIQTKNILDDKIFNFFKDPVNNLLNEFGLKICKINITKCWINSNKKDSHNIIHDHQGAHFSAVYYVDVPEGSGNLIFFRRSSNSVMSDFFKPNTDSAYDYSITPKEGLLVLFPAHILHYVTPGNNEKDRISLSFDIEIQNG